MNSHNITENDSLYPSERRTLQGLELVFLLIVTAAALLNRLPLVLLPVLGLAAFRAGRAVAYDLIFRWLRDLFGVECAPDSAAGWSVQATGSGPKRILGELVTCPICAGQWSAALLVLAYAVWPEFGTILMYVLAAAGVLELLDGASEFLSWGGRLHREQAGKLNRASVLPAVEPADSLFQVRLSEEREQ